MDISYHAYMYTNTMRSGSGFGSISSFINYKNLFNKINSLLRLAPFFFYGNLFYTYLSSAPLMDTFIFILALPSSLLDVNT